MAVAARERMPHQVTLALAERLEGNDSDRNGFQARLHPVPHRSGAVDALGDGERLRLHRLHQQDEALRADVDTEDVPLAVPQLQRPSTKSTDSDQQRSYACPRRVMASIHYFYNLLPVCWRFFKIKSYVRRVV